MNIWYAICDAMQLDILKWDFMKNALLAVLLIAPLFGLTSTMIVTGKMSFFSDALGHSAFTGIAIGAICGITNPTWVAVLLSILISLLFSYIKSRSNHASDTLIGVFSSTAVALGIFVATLDGNSFTKYNRYLIGDILSVSASELSILALVLVGVILFWLFFSNRILLSTIHPQLTSSRGISVYWTQTIFTTMIAVIVTLAISWVGLLILNSLLVLPGAASRNVSRNLRQYHLLSVVFALIAGITGLILSYYFGASSGAAISITLSLIFLITFFMRKARA